MTGKTDFSEEEWETAFNALIEGIAVVGPDGAILRANRALAAAFGCTLTWLTIFP